VRDSKTLSDKRCRNIAEALRAGYPHSVVAVGPEKYNELYARMRNLNKLLAWGHARVIENLLEQVPAVRAVTDQFGDAKFVLNALLKKGRTIELVQRPRAEEDAAVAAASILARAEFLKRLELLGRDWGLDLPKGAGPPVDQAAAAFVKRHGAEALAKVAKTHFKTTERALRAV
jgi:ribonuclease HIII